MWASLRRSAFYRSLALDQGRYSLATLLQNGFASEEATMQSAFSHEPSVHPRYSASSSTSADRLKTSNKDIRLCPTNFIKEP